MFVDYEFKLKDDSRGIPSHVLTPLFDIYHWLCETGGSDYYINYSGRGRFHFGYQLMFFSLEQDLHGLMSMDVLGPWHLKAFFWLKRNTIYKGSSENDGGSATHPDDFFEYVENTIKNYKK